MKININDILTTKEDPEEVFQLLEKLGTIIIEYRSRKLRKCF